MPSLLDVQGVRADVFAHVLLAQQWDKLAPAEREGKVCEARPTLWGRAQLLLPSCGRWGWPCVQTPTPHPASSPGQPTPMLGAQKQPQPSGEVAQALLARAGAAVHVQPMLLAHPVLAGAMAGRPALLAGSPPGAGVQPLRPVPLRPGLLPFPGSPAALGPLPVHMRPSAQGSVPGVPPVQPNPAAAVRPEAEAGLAQAAPSPAAAQAAAPSPPPQAAEPAPAQPSSAAGAGQQPGDAEQDEAQRVQRRSPSAAQRMLSNAQEAAEDA